MNVLQKIFWDFLQNPLILEKAQPFLPTHDLPSTEAIRKKLGLPSANGAEIAVSLGGLLGDKQYSIFQWLDVIHFLHEARPDLRFNIFYKNDRFFPYPKDMMESMVQRMREKGIECSLVEAPSLNDVKALVQEHLCMVAHDTALAHMSIALGIPTVTIFAPNIGEDMSQDIWAASAKVQHPVSLVKEDMVKGTLREIYRIDDISPRRIADTVINVIPKV